MHGTRSSGWVLTSTSKAHCEMLAVEQMEHVREGCVQEIG